jgi:hypothetical protein
MQRSTIALTMLALASLWAAAQAQSPPPGPSAGNANGPPMPPPPPEPRGPRPPDVIARGPSIDLALEAARPSSPRARATMSASASSMLPERPSSITFRMARPAPMPTPATARRIRRWPSRCLRARSLPPPKPIRSLAAKYAADASNYVTWAGGILITVGGEVIGAIGVSGAEPSEKDEACAIDGLNKIKSRLK